MNMRKEKLLEFIKSEDNIYPPRVFFNFNKFILEIVSHYYDNNPYYSDSFSYALDLYEDYDYSDCVEELSKLLKEANLIKDYKIATKEISNLDKTSPLKTIKRLIIDIYLNADSSNICRFYNYHLSGLGKIELYSDSLQKAKMAEYIFKKTVEFDNNNITLKMRQDGNGVIQDNDYFQKKDLGHIRIARVLSDLEDDGIISIDYIEYYDGDSVNASISLINPRKLKKLFEKETAPKQELTPLNKAKSIYISELYGIYSDEVEKGHGYLMKRGSDRSIMVEHLSNKVVSSSELSRFLNGKSDALISKEIREINNNFKKCLCLDDNLIIRFPANGYSLNSEKFNIIFIDK